MSNGSEAQHANLGFSEADGKTDNHTDHPEAQWFPKAGLGMFIHWGIASVHGDLDLSWGMIANSGYDAAAEGRNKLCPDDYWRLAEDFQPDRYDPHKWLAAAARAGMTYAVLTCMHHDGYTMWPSKYGELGVQSHLGGRDLVGPFIEACRAHGLKAGLYYSPADWHVDRAYRSFNYGSEDQNRFPGRPHYDTRHRPFKLTPKPAGHLKTWRETWMKRVEELLTRYGRIDLLWFDGGGHDNDIRDRARELQPHLVINSRSCDGDFGSSECSLPQNRPSGWFETPHCWQASDLQSPQGTMVDFWGYLKEEKYKPTAWMLSQLAQLRAWGANLLINVGPRPNGELPEIVYRRLKETADWMAHSSDAVIGTEAGSYPDMCNVPVTVGPTHREWYLLFLPGESPDALFRVPVVPQKATVLRTGESLVIKPETDRSVRITLSNTQRSDLVDTVRVEFPLTDVR